MTTRRFVFLQHGVIKDNMSSFLKKSIMNIHGFITSATPEYLSIFGKEYNSTEKEVWLTGLPRFDRLYRNSNIPKQITVCPTWRKALMGPMDPETDIFTVLPTMHSSAYLLFFKSLFKDERLLSAARRFGFRLAFFPHPMLQPHVALFELDPDVLLQGNASEYRDVCANSALLLTDCSSAVARLIEYMENGCRMKPKYRERVDSFLAFNGKKNCQRVCDAILVHQPDRKKLGS